MSTTQNSSEGGAPAAFVTRTFGWWQAFPDARKFSLAITLLVVVGVALRVWHFAGGRSFFIDEAYIALNLTTRTFLGMLGPLDYSQTAPLGWLLSERAMLSLFGWMTPEFSLRLPSLVAGVASVIIYAAIAKRRLDVAGAIGAVLLFALSDRLLAQSSMVKQYSGDVFFAVAFMWVGAAMFLDRKPLTWGVLAVLTVAGCLAVSYSFPAAFVLGSLGGLLFLRELLEGRWPKAVGVAAASALWLGLFVAMMLSIQTAQTDTITTMKTEGWDSTFAPFPPLSLHDIKWYVSRGGHILHFMFQPPAIILVILLICGGVVTVYRKSWMFLTFLVLPLAFALVASMLKFYPFGGRLLLFLFPAVYFVTAAGIDFYVNVIGPRLGRTVTALVLIAGVSVSLMMVTASFYQNLSTPFDFEDIKPAMDLIADQKQEGDAVYVYFAAYPAFTYYRDQTGLADVTVIQGSISRYDWGCYYRDIERIRPHGRVWMVFSHTTPASKMDDFLTMRYVANQYGKELLSKAFGHDHNPLSDVKVLLFDFSGPDASKPALPFAAPEDADTVCIRKGAIS